MWIVTTDNQTVNIAEARRLVVEAWASPEKVSVVAYYGSGDSIVLAEAHQPDAAYARALADAYYKAIQNALCDGESFCDLNDHSEVVRDFTVTYHRTEITELQTDSPRQQALGDAAE
jgi:L-fucose mutarotase/ribose pyranase (RbsD/FucU family)